MKKKAETKKSVSKPRSSRLMNCAVEHNGLDYTAFVMVAVTGKDNDKVFANGPTEKEAVDRLYSVVESLLRLGREKYKEQEHAAPSVMRDEGSIYEVSASAMLARVFQWAKVHNVEPCIAVDVAYALRSTGWNYARFNYLNTEWETVNSLVRNMNSTASRVAHATVVKQLAFEIRETYFVMNDAQKRLNELVTKLSLSPGEVNELRALVASLRR